MLVPHMFTTYVNIATRVLNHVTGHICGSHSFSGDHHCQQSRPAETRLFRTRLAESAIFVGMPNISVIGLNGARLLAVETTTQDMYPFT